MMENNNIFTLLAKLVLLFDVRKLLFYSSLFGIGIAFADDVPPDRAIHVNTAFGDGILQLSDVTLPGALVTVGYLLAKWQPKISIEIHHKMDESSIKAIIDKLEEAFKKKGDDKC